MVLVAAVLAGYSAGAWHRPTPCLWREVTITGQRLEPDRLGRPVVIPNNDPTDPRYVAARVCLRPLTSAEVNR